MGRSGALAYPRHSDAVGMGQGLPQRRIRKEARAEQLAVCMWGTDLREQRGEVASRLRPLISRAR